MSRPTLGEIKHKDHIKYWLDNPDAEVYFKTPYGTWTRVSGQVHWFVDYEYRVIEFEYQKLWEAWLDDELEFKSHLGSWEPIHRSDSEPCFCLPASAYRRKPKELKSYTFKAADGVTEYFLNQLGEGAVITATNSATEQYNVDILCKIQSAR